MGIIRVIKNYRAMGREKFFQAFMEGVNGVSQLEQAKIQQNSNWLSTAGVVCGIVVSAWQWKSMWWVFIILLGGLGLQAVQLLAGAQKIKLLKEIDAIQNEDKEVENV